MPSEIKFFAISSEPTTDWSLGKQVLAAFEETGTQLIPEVLFHWDDKIGPFISVEQVEPYWAQVAQMRVNGVLSEFSIGLRWKRNKVAKYEAEISHTRKDARGNTLDGRLSVYAPLHKKTDWRHLGARICEVMNADLAMLHCFTSFDNEPAQSNTPESYFRSFTIVDAKIPNIGWGMFYGRRFVHEVDEAAISAAGFPVQRIGEGYLVQVTEDINDVVNDFDRFSKRRAELKSLFRDDLFLIKDEPKVS